MRFMLLMIPQGYESAAPGTMPDAAHVSEMMAFNEEMRKAGVLISLDGLHPPSVGARVSFASGKPEVISAPFPGVKEVLGGYWMIQVASQDEAVSWATRCPALPGETIEVRRVQEMEDFSPEIRRAVE